MHAELAHLDLPEQRPQDAAHFSVEVTASIGPHAGEGAELFNFEVCTPSWLAEHASLPKGFAFLRHVLLMERWDESLLERAIRDLCLRTEGDSWHEVATKLSRFAYWEFEDYREG